MEPYNPNDDLKLLDGALALLNLNRQQHIELVTALNRLGKAAQGEPQKQAPAPKAPAIPVETADGAPAPKKRGRPPKAKQNGIAPALA